MLNELAVNVFLCWGFGFIGIDSNSHSGTFLLLRTAAKLHTHREAQESNK